jgi:cell division transport system ATP-binding protein
MSMTDRANQEIYQLGVLARLTGVDAGYQVDPVLHQVHFEANAGEAALVCGPTSAGKTTLMHVLRLALVPRRGRALILGAEVGKLSGAARARLKRRIGYIAENPSFVEHWTAYSNIAMPLRAAGLKPPQYAEDVRELAEFVGLDAAVDEPVSRLSAAARRLVAIARALVAKPEIILADDPTSGMSPEAGRRVVRMLMEMRRVGAGVIIASQDESLAEVGPCTLWRISHGRLIRGEVSAPDGYDRGGYDADGADEEADFG